MRFIVTFVPAEGPLLAVGERQPIGLAGLDQIRKANSEIEATDVLYKVNRKAYPRIATELSEACARLLHVYFQDKCEIEVKVPGDLPLQQFVRLVVAESRDRLTWKIDHEDVKYAWLLAGAPLEWSPTPDEERVPGPITEDEETEFLRAQTMRKLQEFEPSAVHALADAYLIAGQGLYVETLVERLAQDGSTDLWTNLIGIHALRQIDAIDTRIEKIKFLRNMVCCGRSKLVPSRDAIDARTHWLKSQETASSWKDALLHELHQEDACIMGVVGRELASVPNDLDFDDVPTNADVRELISDHGNWLNNRQNVVKLMPPLWQKFYNDL